jgi:hypothetical protein
MAISMAQGGGRIDLLFASIWRNLSRLAAALLLGFGGPSAAKAQMDPEAAAWDEAQRLGTDDAYQDYLAEFPMGAHAQDAFVRMILLSELGDLAPASGPTDAGSSY